MKHMYGIFLASYTCINMFFLLAHLAMPCIFPCITYVLGLSGSSETSAFDYRTYSVIGIHSNRHNGATFLGWVEGDPGKNRHTPREK